MKLIVKNYDIDASEPTVLLHDRDCLEIGVKENDRVNISGTRSAVALVSRSDTLVDEGIVMMPAPLMERCGVREGEEVNVVYCQNPDSVRSIRRKMDGEKLSKEEIDKVIPPFRASIEAEGAAARLRSILEDADGNALSMVLQRHDAAKKHALAAYRSFVLRTAGIKGSFSLPFGVAVGVWVPFWLPLATAAAFFQRFFTLHGADNIIAGNFVQIGQMTVVHMVAVFDQSIIDFHIALPVQFFCQHCGLRRIDDIVVTNSIERTYPDDVSVISIAPMIAGVIKATENGETVPDSWMAFY